MSWDQILTANPAEHDVRLKVEGELPALLSGGSYYLNGPGLLKQYSSRLHPFDGHGMVRKLAFSEDSAHFQNRFIHTTSYLKEKKARKICYRGIAGLPHQSRLKNWLCRETKNPANTTVLPWQNGLLCGYEGGLPYMLDSETLETLGQQTFGDTVEQGTKLLAHTRYDADKEELFCVSLKPGKHTSFQVFGYDSKGRNILRTDFQHFGMTIIHDFLLTPSYVVIMENPVIPDIPLLIKSMMGLNSLISSLNQQQRPARLMLFPRAGGAPRIIEMDKSCMAFHHASAVEHKNEAGEVVGLELYSCIFDQYDDFGREFGYQGNDQAFSNSYSEGQQPQKLSRVQVDLTTEKVSTEAVSDWGLDFPTIHPLNDGKNVTHIYGAAAAGRNEFGPSRTILRLSPHTGESQSWHSNDAIVGEPYFVPSGTTEEAGVVLSMLYRPGETELIVLSAEQLSAGPIARIRLPEAFPYGFHGFFQGVA